jgi:quercetin dioxygenase-like cupin family protein
MKTIFGIVSIAFPFLMNLIKQLVSGSLTRKPLLIAELGPPKTASRVEIKQLEFKPLQMTGLHTHPVPVVGYIAQGEITFQVEGQAVRTLHAGDACFEPANVEIRHFDNPSPTNPATYIAFYLMGESDHDLIHMLNA